MALFHFHVTQIKRSTGQSIVTSAAYRAGEKLFSEYYGEVSDYTHKGGVVCTGILLPPQAPVEYQDRATLWNAVEKAERGKKAQLAYSFDIALQNEFSLDENIALARQFVSEQLVGRGMIADFAIHQPDKEDGGIPNPHFHILCPIRPIEPDGKWGCKQRRRYRLDEDGNRIMGKDGKALFDAVPTTDWGDPATLEEWRRVWAEMVNAKFEEKGLTCRIDHRSYKRQGVDTPPTIHEGAAVRQMEAKGITTNKGDFNRWVKKARDLLRELRAKISDLTDWIKAEKEELSKAHCPTLADAHALGDYYQARNAGAYSQKAKVGNLKRYAADIAFLESKGLTTVDDLHDFVSALSGDYFTLRDSLNAKSERMKELQTLLRLASDYARLKPIVDAIPAKGGFGKKREKYLAEHDSEISQYYAVCRKLENAVPDKKLTVKAWQSELDRLGREYAAESGKLKPMWDDLKKLNDIQYKADSALHDRQRSRQITYEQER